MAGNYSKEQIIADIGSLGSFPSATLFTILPLILGRTEVFVRLLLAMIIIHTVTVLIRSVYFKERPQKIAYKNTFQRLDASSFPSLHSARAGVYATAYLSHPALTVFLTVIALAIMWTRVYERKHDVVDVFFGALLGSVTGYLLWVLW